VSPTLLEKKLIFVTGKGGVGKTATAAALGRLLADTGRRTLVCELDTDPAMGRIFGQDVGFEPTRVAPKLFACNLTADDSMRAFVERFVPSRRIASLILNNTVANIFFRSAPSVMEAVLLDRLATLATESAPPYDSIIVDLPASGHAVTFLNVPKSMARMVSVGELADHLRRIAKLIADPNKSEVVIVSLPDEMAVNESLELWRNLHANVDTPTRTVVVNGVRAPSLREEDVERVRDLAKQHPEVEFGSLLEGLELGAYWKREDGRNVVRLADSIDGTVVTVPFVFDKENERELVQRISDGLRTRLIA
jgi:anion-transporting  ArsA/GET3 family ATPase